MSQKSIKILHEVARARGMTETDVVETCVAKFALSIGQDVDRAKELLFEQICRAAANSPVNVANMRETRADATAESRSSGPNVESAGQSAAGELAITAAESAGRKQGAGRKK